METQEEKIRQYAKYKGYELRGIYKDEGISGGDIDGRDNLIKMLKVVKRGYTVIVLSLTRLARNLAQTLKIESYLSRKGCALATIDYELDTSKAMGKFFFHIMGSLSEMEKNTISERVTLNMRHLASQGKLKSKPPFGFKFVAKNMPFQPDLDEQETIERIRQLKQETPLITYTEICRILTAEKRKPRLAKVWYPGRIRDIMVQNNIAH